MSAATTVNVASAAIPEKQNQKVSPVADRRLCGARRAGSRLAASGDLHRDDFVQVGGRIHQRVHQLLLPAKWVLDNYMTLIEASASYPVLNWLGNSLIISTVFAVLSVCIVALAGFGYSRLNFKYCDTLFFVLLLISMFPAANGDRGNASSRSRLGQHLLGLHHPGLGNRRTSSWCATS